MAMALDVFEGRMVLLAQFDANDADRRFEPMRAEADAAEMRESHGGADRGVTAHPEIAGVVEEDEAGGAGRIDRLAEKGADKRVIPAGLGEWESTTRMTPQPFAPRHSAYQVWKSLSCASAKRFWPSLNASDSLKCSAYSGSS